MTERVSKVIFYSRKDGNKSFSLSGNFKDDGGNVVIDHMELGGSFASTDAIALAQFEFEEELTIPRDLVKEKNGAYYFLEKSDIESLARHRIEKLNNKRRKLRDQLAEPIRIKEGSEILGTTSFADISLNIAPSVIDPDAHKANKFSDDAVIFSIKAEFSIDSTLNLDFGGGESELNIEGKSRLDVVITYGDLRDLANLYKKALARLDLDLPTFPGFNIDLPHFALPKLSLDLPEFNLQDVNWPNIFPFSLPIPKIGSTGISAKWTTRPRFKLSVENSDLNLAQVANADGHTEGVLALGVDGVDTELLTLTLTDFLLTKDSLAVNLSTKVETPEITLNPFEPIKFLGLEVLIGTSTLKLDLQNKNLTVTHRITAAQGHGIIIRDATDHTTALHFDLEVDYVSNIDSLDEIKTQVKIFEIRKPYPISLIKDLAEQAGKYIRLIGKIPLPSLPGGPPIDAITAVLEKLMGLIRAAATSLGKQAAGVGNVLAGAGEAIGETIQNVFEKLILDKNGYPNLVIELRLDPKTYKPLQLMIMPAGEPIDLNYEASFLGFDLLVDGGMRPALVFDRVHDWFGMALLPAQSGETSPHVILESDLWLSRSDGPTQPLGLIEDAPSASPGAKKQPKLVRLRAQLNKAASGTYPLMVLAALQRGKLKLFRTMESAEEGETLELHGSGSEYAVTLGASGELKKASVGFKTPSSENFLVSYDVDQSVLDELKERALSILPKGSGSSSSSGVGELVQRIQITDVKAKLSNWKATITLSVKIKLKQDFEPSTDLSMELDLESLDAKLRGGSKIAIKALGKKSYEPLGLLLELAPKSSEIDLKKDYWTVFNLDLSRGAERFALSDEADARLSYKRVSTSGRGLVFKLNEFAASRSGFDLAAKVLPEPVTLGGVKVPFRFTSGQISIKGSRFNSASLVGSGQLPPALVGEANASIAMQLGRDPKGKVAVLGATARLDKSGDPIRCNSTMFELTITELGFDFVNDGAYHFYFLLTGSAAFRPSGGAFAKGVLSRLKEVEIKLDKAPLGGKSSVLMRSLSFLVKVDPPTRTNVFEIFDFDLRGVGFYPAAEAFGGEPALAISGQVKFADFGDMVSPRFDFHKLWIAGPKKGESLPQVRFDGLTVGLKTGTIDVEGTAIAVDGNLPSLYEPDVLPADIKADGFLASAKLGISGWGQMSGAVGFLELRPREGAGETQHSFFIYGQLEKQTVPINTPVGRIVLREYGFGFGRGYTLAGIAQSQKATSPQELVRILDEISKYQGSLNRFEAWEPTYGNRDLTLALRGMFSIASGSPDNGEYKPKAEKKLPNPLLFDIVAALRTDLTFLINLRAWVATNYHDWTSSPSSEPFKSNPTLRGYLYFSVPRKEFLARMLSDPGGHVGEHPQLPEQLVKAIKAVRFSSTLYIRPGLFHMEFGWPYELGFDLGKPKDAFYLRLRGGLINRIEDFSLLYGMAFRADGHVKFGGSVGGSSFGASASALAVFSLEAKILAYLSLKRFGDSIFYGMLRFDTTLRMRVEVWLSFRIFRKRIRLSIGFSLSLAIAIGVEAVVSPNGLGGRAHVAVGVRGFGRTLSLGINLSFNDRLLNRARAQVSRFEAMGLAAEVPPASGDGRRVETIPRPDTPRRETLDVGDDRINGDLGNVSEPIPQPNLDEFKLETYTGDPIMPTDFWAMLYPIQGESDQYVMVLVPRDHTDQVKGDRSTFYSSPSITGNSENAEYEASHLIVDGDMSHLKILKEGRLLMPEQEDTANQTDKGLVIPVAVDHEISSEDSASEKISLGALMQTMFLNYEVGNSVTLTEPRSRGFDEKETLLPDDPQGAADLLGRIGRTRIHLPAKERVELEIEEARSSIISSISESADTLAQNWLSDGDVQSTGAVDARVVGLVFKVSQQDIDTLFEEESKDKQRPREGKFKVVKRDVGGADWDNIGDAGSVQLFNSPERMFRKAQPSFVPVEKLTDEGIKMDWDLEPSWTASKNVYDDPEYHLKHYRIRRRIVRTGDGNDYSSEFTVKAAAPIEFLKDEKSGNSIRRTIRAPYQFVDDLRNSENDNGVSRPIPKKLRDRILGLGPTDHIYKGEITVEYDILPVDIAGTSTFGEPLEVLAADPVEPPLRSPAEATLQVAYGAMPTLVGIRGTKKNSETSKKQATLHPGFRLLLRDAPTECHQKSDRWYQLRIWRDRAQPSGGYGSDAVTQGRSRLDEAQIEALTVDNADVTDFVLKLKEISGPNMHSDMGLPVTIETLGNEGDPDFEEWFEATLTKGQPEDGKYDTEDLSKELHAACYGFDKEGKLTPEPGRSTWVYLRAIQSSSEKDKKRRLGEWRCVSINLAVLGRLKKPVTTTPLPVDATVETFEQPVSLHFKALRREDMAIRSGRLHIFRPGAQSSLLDFLKSPDTTIFSAPDPARRTATRLTWNARPGSLQIKGLEHTYQGNDLYRWISGFEIYRLNPDTYVGDRENLNQLARAAESIGTLRMLPAAERGLSPSGFGDMSRLEMNFPSLAWRYGEGQAKVASTNQAATVHATPPWFSAAESIAIFPRPRLRRCLFADLEEGMVAELFANGRPKTVVVRVKGVHEVKLEYIGGWGIAEIDKSNTKSEGWVVSLTPADASHGFKVEELRETLRGIAILPQPDDIGQAAALVSEEKLLERKANPQLILNQTSKEKEDPQLAAVANLGVELLAFNYAKGNPKISTTLAKIEKAEKSIFKTKTSLTNGSITPLIAEKRIAEDNKKISEAKKSTITSAEQDIEILPDLHPILLDTLSLATLTHKDQPNKPYRRYSIVPDDQAPNTSDSLARFAEELPAERDPHGFNALRSLGLATGFQIYDTEIGQFLRGNDLFQQINKAFKDVLGVYRKNVPPTSKSDEGLPFVDILTVPWGNGRLYWFDGGAEQLEAESAVNLRDNDTLAAVQIALRPALDRVTQGTPEFSPLVRYAELRFEVKDSVPVRPPAYHRFEAGNYRLDRFHVSLPSSGAPELTSIDILPPNYGLEALTQVRLRNFNSSESELDPEAVAMIGNVPETGSVLAQLRCASHGDTIVPVVSDILVEAVYTRRDSDDENDEIVISIEELNKQLKEDQRVHLQMVCSNFVASKPGTLEGGLGRFDPFNGSEWGALLYRSTPENIETIAIPAVERLSDYAKRHFGRFLKEGVDLTDENQRSAVGGMLVKFWQRFLDHTAIPDPSTQGEGIIHFSLGTVADPGNWQQAPDRSGRVSIVVPDVDRRGARRAFAVQPTGRYDAWVNAADWHMVNKLDPSDPPVRELIEGFAPLPLGLQGALDKDADLHQFINSTLPRTEPLEKPVILSAIRHVEGDELDGRGRFEVAVAHPSDMVLAAANQNNVAKLAPQELSIGLWRRFPHETWLLQAVKAASIDNADLYPLLNPLAAIGSREYSDGVTRFDRGEAQGQLEALRENVPDAWLGTTVFSFSQTPYFYRIETRVYSAAGNIVSEPASVTFDEGFPQLHHPSKETLPDKGYEGRESAKKPGWSILKDPGNGDRYLLFDLPLLRFIDAMTKEDAQLWFGKDFENGKDIKELVHLPDPDTSYRIAFETLADPETVDVTRVTEARAFEVDISPQVAKRDTSDIPLEDTEKTQGIDEKMYAARATGSMLSFLGGLRVQALRARYEEERDWRIKLYTVVEPVPVGLSLNQTTVGDLQREVARLGSEDGFELRYDTTIRFGDNPPNAEDWNATFGELVETLNERGLMDLAKALKEEFSERPVEIEDVRFKASIPGRFWNEDGSLPQVAEAFFGGGIPMGAPVLLLKHPPLREEVDLVKEFLTSPTDIDRVVMDWLFGANRRPALLSMRGTLPPISTIIQAHST